MTALRCERLAVSPGGVPVLRGLSLDLAAATTTALVGPSGAGKTTLLRAIAGLERLDAGEVHLGDRRIDGLPAHRRRIAVVFQEPRLLGHLSVRENVALPLRAAGAGRATRRDRARAALAEVGLDGVAERTIGGLSGGEAQRVALARALCAEPELLLLDEPLAALDPNRRGELRRLVARVQAERALTTLVITHDRGEAAELGDRIALMLDGEIVQHDVPRALFERPASLAAARFLGAQVLDGQAIRPEHVALDPDGPLAATVVEAVYTGAHVRLGLALDDGTRLEGHVAPEAAPPAGARVRLRLPAEHRWAVPGAPSRSADPP